MCVGGIRRLAFAPWPRCGSGPGSAIELVVEIAPGRVHLFDELELPCASPVLYFVFARTRIHQPVVMLVINELGHVISGGESRCELFLVFPDAPRQIARRAVVKRAVAAR